MIDNSPAKDHEKTPHEINKPMLSILPSGFFFVPKIEQAMLACQPQTSKGYRRDSGGTMSFAR
jgi:hypothetical protein